MGKMVFNSIDAFSEFGADLIRTRSREGLAIARPRGKLRVKQPSPNIPTDSQREFCHIHATREYSISDLAEFFSVSLPTIYRKLTQCHSH